MAEVSCPGCGTENEPGEPLCRLCGLELADVDARAATTVAAQAREPVAVVDTHDACPHCGAEVPDPGNQICVECLLPMAPSAPPAGHAPPSATVHERGAPATLRLWFGPDTVTVPAGGAELLGRDPRQSPHAALFASRDNVSRRHASVGFAADGAGWVRDESSANGTFVNDRPVPQGGTVPLADGDVLRMASDVVARIEFERPAAR